MLPTAEDIIRALRSGRGHHVRLYPVRRAIDRRCDEKYRAMTWSFEFDRREDRFYSLHGIDEERSRMLGGLCEKIAADTIGSFDAHGLSEVQGLAPRNDLYPSVEGL